MGSNRLYHFFALGLGNPDGDALPLRLLLGRINFAGRPVLISWLPILDDFSYWHISSFFLPEQPIISPYIIYSFIAPRR